MIASHLGGRQSFFEAQAGHRRKAAFLGVLALAMMLLGGLPLAMILSPLILAIVVVVLDIVNLLAPMPDLFGSYLEQRSAPDRSSTPWPLIATLLVLPGMLAILLLWLLVRMVFLRSGLTGLAAHLGARPADRGDIEELQLANIVEEMAVAAGMQPPDLLMIDSPSINVGAVGRSDGDAIVIVTRGLLDRCDRAETQAALGHVIATIADGDQRLYLSLLALAATFGLLPRLLAMPASPKARSLLRDIARIAFPGEGRSDAADADLIDRLLSAFEDPAIEAALRDHSRQAQAWRLIYAPFIFGGKFFELFKAAVFGPLQGPFLRSALKRRRVLADALAVQLTRDPASLQGVLRKTENAPCLEIGNDNLHGMLFMLPIGREENEGAFLGKGDVHPSRFDRLWRLGRLGGDPSPEPKRPPFWMRLGSGTEGMTASHWIGLVIIVPLAIVLTMFLVVAGLAALAVIPLFWLFLSLPHAFLLMWLSQQLLR